MAVSMHLPIELLVLWMAQSLGSQQSDGFYGQTFMRPPLRPAFGSPCSIATQPVASKFSGQHHPRVVGSSSGSGINAMIGVSGMNHYNDSESTGFGSLNNYNGAGQLHPRVVGSSSASGINAMVGVSGMGHYNNQESTGFGSLKGYNGAGSGAPYHNQQGTDSSLGYNIMLELSNGPGGYSNANDLGLNGFDGMGTSGSNILDGRFVPSGNPFRPDYFHPGRTSSSSRYPSRIISGRRSADEPDNDTASDSQEPTETDSRPTRVPQFLNYGGLDGSSSQVARYPFQERSPSVQGQKDFNPDLYTMAKPPGLAENLLDKPYSPRSWSG